VRILNPLSLSFVSIVQASTVDGRVLVWGQPYELRNMLRLRRTASTSGRRLANVLSSLNAWLSPSGELGGAAPIPVAVSGLPPDERVVQVACGAGLTAARAQSGALYLFGLNAYGQCGVGLETMTEFSPTRALGALDPTPPPEPGAPPPMLPVAESAKARIARLAERRVEAQALPPWCAEQKVVDVALGFQHGACVTAGGAVLTWGKGERGQLGLGEQENAAEPKPCPLLRHSFGWPTCDRADGTEHPVDDERSWRYSDVRAWPGQPKAVGVSCGFCHTAVLTEGGDVFVWGKHLSLRIAGEDPTDNAAGDGSDGGNSGLLASIRAMRSLVAKHDDQLRPRKLEGLPRPAVAVACSAFHTTILTDDGQLWCVGMRFGSRATSPEPVLLRAPLPLFTSGEDAAAAEVVGNIDAEARDSAREDGQTYSEDSEEAPAPNVDLASALAAVGDRAVGLRGGPAATGTAVLTASGRVVTVLFDGSSDGFPYGEEGDFSGSQGHGDGRLLNGELPMTALVSALSAAWPPKPEDTYESSTKPAGSVVDAALGWQHGLFLTK